MKSNLDDDTVKSFGDEWSRFNQSGLEDEEARRIFDEYFAVFPWDALPHDASGFDMGCGTGRWARLMAPKVGHLHCIDPSAALNVSRRMLAEQANVSFHAAGVADEVLSANSQDFGYSLGVLHHIPDTEAGIRACVDLLKPGAPFLVYLYYAFDNRSMVFKLIWRCSDLLRRGICRLPPGLKNAVTDIIAALVYFPLARLSRFGERAGLNVGGVPLAYYRKHSFYTMRTDARDRFGTPLERRFNRTQIEGMLRGAGLADIRFSPTAPFWCAVGFKS